MSIEDVAERADVWSAAVKKIIKAIVAAGIALVAGISGLMMLWPSSEGKPEEIRTELIIGGGYSVQCSQFMNTIDITWTEQQWSVWEQLRKGMDC